MKTHIATSLEQSKKLIELGIDVNTADMWWNFYSVTTDDTTPQIIHIDTPWVGSFNWANKPDNIPAWSLTALLDVYPMIVGRDMGMYCCWQNSKHLCSRHYDNPVDACYEMILKLHEQKLL